MFMELIDKSGKCTVNTDHITMIFPDGERTGIKLIDYKASIHVDMDYKEFMDKFRTINMLNDLMEVSK